MPRSNFFLRTKLMPPRAGAQLIPRPRLTRKLEENTDAPVTLIAADAGCGKTTLVADFLRRQNRPFVWYQLDHTDADPIAFLGYIAHGIREFTKDFGKALLPYLAEAHDELLGSPERGVDLLINEILESVQQPFILVLDDYHHIGRETAVHGMVDRLIQYSSDLVHVMITTRDLPPLAIMRRRMQAAALVISRDDLLFNDAEIRELFRSALDLDLDETALNEYRERTHGWITALQLVRQIAEQELHSNNHNRGVDLVAVLRQTEKDIFDYFAEEVFSREDADTQKLLMALALLDSLPLDVCSELFPDLRCSALLPELAQKNVFLTVAGDRRGTEEYRFHPLFRDFLRRRLRSVIGKSGVEQERRRIARHYLDEGSWEQALPYLVDAESFDEAAAIIAKRGGEWLSGGAYATLDLFIDRIPEQYQERHPHTLLHRAEIERMQGELDSSAALLKRAVALFDQTGDTAGEAEALHSLASLARRRARFDEAIELLDRAEKLAPKNSETLLKCANTRGLCLINQGRWAEAEQQFQIGLEQAERQSNLKYIRLITHNLALPAGFRGDFGAALRWFKRIFHSDTKERPLPQEAIGHLNVARLHLYRGELEEAQTHLERALELCQLFNMRPLLGEIFEALGNYYRERGDAPHAEEYYERSLKAYADAEVDLSTRELNEERAHFALQRGDAAAARSLLEGLIAERQERGNEAGVRTANLGLARVDLEEGKTAGLEDRVCDLIEYFREKSHYYDETLASMLMAELLIAADRVVDAMPYVSRVLDLAARYDYDHWLRQQIRRVPAVFAIEEVAERLPNDLRSELGKSDGFSPSAVEVGTPGGATVTEAVPLTDLTVRVLGPIEIFRDPTRPFAADAWTTRRARDIFCCVATSRHRRVSKDILIETFWPDEDPRVVEKNFHPTISHIRKALNSRQPFKQNFLVFRDGAYQLNPELSFLIDTEEFDRHFSDAEAAKREKDGERLRASLIAAHDAYRGEFMTGVYEDWVEERRAFYTEQFARVTSALARHELSEKRLASAKKYASETLALDPYREDIHRLVMKILAAQGKRPALQKHFDQLQSLLRSDLGIDPAPETLKVYKELLK